MTKEERIRQVLESLESFRVRYLTEEFIDFLCSAGIFTPEEDPSEMNGDDLSPVRYSIDQIQDALGDFSSDADNRRIMFYAYKHLDEELKKEEEIVHFFQRQMSGLDHIVAQLFKSGKIRIARFNREEPIHIFTGTTSVLIGSSSSNLYKNYSVIRSEDRKFADFEILTGFVAAYSATRLP